MLRECDAVEREQDLGLAVVGASTILLLRVSMPCWGGGGPKEWGDP